jgi:serine phosphatase RsbU (regulator of sigma subunit)
MSNKKPEQEGLDYLADELHNFQEIAAYLNPSPGELPRLRGMDIAGLSMPLKDIIGGDHLIYLDFKRRHDLNRRIAEAKEEGRDKVAAKLEKLRRRAGILVADVSGHRMTDALIGAMLHQAFLVGVYYELDQFGEVTTRIFENINTRFYRTTAVNKYFTMIYGEISEDGRFRFISAGHQPPAVFSREFGRFVEISKDRLISFPPVGMLPSDSDPDRQVESSVVPYKRRYEVNEINLLNRGDIVLLFTDGFSEHDGGGFFPARVESLLANCPNCSAEETCARLERAILDAGEPDDDISVVVIRRTY